MKIHKIKISNYRSIKNAEIYLNNKTIILGRNNEGKSNVIKGIQLSVKLINAYSMQGNILNNNSNRRLPQFFLRETDFDFQRDIEQGIVKAKKSTRYALISVTYILNERERENLNDKLVTRTKTDGIINVEFRFLPTEEIEVRIRIKEEGNAIRNTKNMVTVLRFLSDNYKLNFIPSIRTTESAVKIVRSLMLEDLRSLEEDEEYLEALKTIERVQQNRMDSLGEELQRKLASYVPNIKSLKINSSRPNRLRAMNNAFDLIIDDGVETMLEDKGDGIISLVAISLLHLSDSNINDGLIIIDEPEAHLHSGAITKLKNTLEELSGNSQLIISTHHQIFVDREEISNNYIVSDGSVKKTKTVRQVRDTLEISMSENLLNAEHLIIVEGETDLKFIMSYIKLSRLDILELIKNRKVAIVKIGGVKNLNSQLIMYNNCISNYTVLLDHDRSSKDALSIIFENQLLKQKNLFYCVKIGKDESEIEDLLNDDIIIDTIKSIYNIDIESRLNKSANKKFSNQISDILSTYGKSVGSEDLMTIKKEISKLVEKQESIDFINEEGVNILNTMLDNVKNSFN